MPFVSERWCTTQGPQRNGVPTVLSFGVNVDWSRHAAMSERQSQATVDRQRRRRRDGTRVLELRAFGAYPRGIARDRLQRLGVEVGAEGRVAGAEQVLDDAVHFDALRHLVAGAQIDDGKA